MRRLSQIAMVSLLSGALFACNLNHEEAGTMTGGVVGGLIGSQLGSGAGQGAAIFAGTLIGAFIGNQIGSVMDDADRAHVSRALEQAKTGEKVAWVNPDSGHRYVVKPTKTYYVAQANTRQPCREFTTTAIIGGKSQEVYGKACRTADGAWKIIQ